MPHTGWTALPEGAGLRPGVLLYSQLLLDGQVAAFTQGETLPSLDSASAAPVPKSVGSGYGDPHLS